MLVGLFSIAGIGFCFFTFINSFISPAIETKPVGQSNSHMRNFPDAAVPEAPASESPSYRTSGVAPMSSESRMQHLEGLALDALANCLQEYDRFGDNADAQVRCRKIAVQKAQNKYIMGQ